MEEPVRMNRAYREQLIAELLSKRCHKSQPADIPYVRQREAYDDIRRDHHTNRSMYYQQQSESFQHQDQNSGTQLLPAGLDSNESRKRSASVAMQGDNDIASISHEYVPSDSQKRLRYQSLSPLTMRRHEEKSYQQHPVQDQHQLQEQRPSWKQRLLGPPQLHNPIYEFTSSRQSRLQAEPISDKHESSGQDSPPVMSELLRNSHRLGPEEYRIRDVLRNRGSMVFNDRSHATTNRLWHDSSPRYPASRPDVIDLCSPTPSPRRHPLSLLRSDYRPRVASPLGGSGSDNTQCRPLIGYRVPAQQLPAQRPSVSSYAPANSSRDTNVARSRNRARAETSMDVEERRQLRAAQNILLREMQIEREDTDRELFGETISDLTERRREAGQAASLQAQRQRENLEIENLKRQKERELQAEVERTKVSETERAKKAEKEIQDAIKAERLKIQREANKKIEQVRREALRQQAAEKLKIDRERQRERSRAEERNREETAALQNAVKQLGAYASNIQKDISSIKARELTPSRRHSGNDHGSEDGGDMFVGGCDSRSARCKSRGLANPRGHVTCQIFQPEQDDKRQAEWDQRIKEGHVERRTDISPKSFEQKDMKSSDNPAEGRKKATLDDFSNGHPISASLFPQVSPPLMLSAIKLVSDVKREESQKRARELKEAKIAERKSKSRERYKKNLVRRLREDKEKEIRRDCEIKGIVPDQANVDAELDAFVQEKMKEKEQRLRKKEATKNARNSLNGQNAAGVFSDWSTSCISTGASCELTRQEAAEQETVARKLPEEDSADDDPAAQARKASREQILKSLAQQRHNSDVADSFQRAMGTTAKDNDSESEESEEDPDEDEPQCKPQEHKAISETSAQQSTQVDEPEEDEVAAEDSAAAANTSSSTLQASEHEEEATEKLKSKIEHVYLYIVEEIKTIDGEPQGSETTTTFLLDLEEANKIALYRFNLIRSNANTPKTAKFTHQLVDEAFRSSIEFNDRNSIAIRVIGIPKLTSALASFDPAVVTPRLSRRTFFLYLKTRTLLNIEAGNDIDTQVEKLVDGQHWSDRKMANEAACKYFIDFTRPGKDDLKEANINQHTECAEQARGLAESCNSEPDGLACIELDIDADNLSWMAREYCYIGVEVKEVLMQGPIN